MITHRSAQPSEAPDLSHLARRSKAYWGYDSEQLDLWEQDGSFSVPPEACATELVGVAEDESSLIGFYRLSGHAPIGKLSDLWVAPEAIGTGLGKELAHRAMERARDLGFTALNINSEPNAEGFYTHLGATRVGELPAPLAGEPDRVLPTMILRIS
jgi:GNAT superfamily N-acetyltransferase